MTDHQLVNRLAEEYGDQAENIIIMDGHANAWVGVWDDTESGALRLVYDEQRVLKNLMVCHGMTDEGAREWYEFNIVRGLPENGPIVVSLMKQRSKP